MDTKAEAVRTKKTKWPLYLNFSLFTRLSIKSNKSGYEKHQSRMVLSSCRRVYIARIQ